MSNSARAARRTAAAVCSTATLLGAGLAATTAPAWASLTGPGVDAGQNITVFHNIDFVGVFGYGPTGSVITVDVIRAGVRIGTVTAPTVDTPEGPGLEINHGPVGLAQPGDCWEGTTPDIQPGDRIVVTEGPDTDEVTVDDIRFTGPAVQDPTTGDVLVRGVARRADGTPIAPSSLDSGEFRDDTGKLRLAPSRTEATAGVAAGFTMRYTAPYSIERNRNGLTQAQIKAALLAQNGHTTGIGHAAPLPLESMLVDGIAEVPGPALGCEGSPAADPGTPVPDPVTDTVAPTLTARTPTPGAVDVAVGGNVTATFSEPVTGVDRTTVTLTGPGGAVSAAVGYDAASRTVTLNPDQNLSAGASYTAALSGAISDAAGNSLSAAPWTFRTAAATPPADTADTAAPTVTGRSPSTNAKNVARTANVTATFSETVNGVNASTVRLTDKRGSAVAATVTYSDATRTATLDPTASLKANTNYRVTLTNGITDLASNRLGAVTWTFRTAR
jgi:methionine-rich copper-binding protein CopC